MLERDRILQCLRAAMPELQREFPVRSLALFGSIVRGDGTVDSDVDVVAEVDPSIGLGFVTLAERLKTLTNRKVDLISRRAIKPSLWSAIEPELLNV